MKIIPAGHCTMGSSDEEKHWAANHGATLGSVSDEAPQRELTVPSFALGKYDVTRGEYAAFVRALHEKLAAASPNARYVAGSNWGVAFALLVLAMTMAFLAMLFFGAVVEGKRVPFERIGPTLFVLPFGFAVAWALLRMGRAKPYDPKDPPKKFFGA